MTRRGSGCGSHELSPTGHVLCGSDCANRFASQDDDGFWSKFSSSNATSAATFKFTCSGGRSRTTSHGGEDESQTHCRGAVVRSRMDESRVWAGGTFDRCTNCWRRFRGESGGNCSRRVSVAQNPVQERAGFSNADRCGACAGQSGDHRTDAETGGKPATKCDERRTNETER